MTASRWGTFSAAFDAETTAFATIEADFAAEKLRIPCWDFSVELKHQAIENQAVRVDLGEQLPGIGLAYPESAASFTTYVEGLAAAAPTTAPDPTAFSHLLAASLGAHGTAGAGSTIKAASSPTATSVAETDAASHAENSLVAFQMPDGTVEVRPVGAYATDTMALLMALSGAPDEGDIIYGGINFALTEDGPLAKIQGEAIGKNTAQNYRFLGCVGHMTLNEHSSREAQTVSWRLQAADFTRYESVAQVAPELILPAVAAGGEFLIGKYGSTATVSLDWLRVSVEPAREYTAHEAAGSAIGIQDWVLTGAALRVTIHVLDVDEVPAAFTPTTYFGGFNSSDIAEKLFHLLLNFGGKVAGEICSFYFPRLHQLGEPEPVELDGVAAQKITFAATQGATANGSSAKIWALQT
jgi:hypothetical protein